MAHNEVSHPPVGKTAGTPGPIRLQEVLFQLQVYRPEVLRTRERVSLQSPALPSGSVWVGLQVLPHPQQAGVRGEVLRQRHQRAQHCRPDRHFCISRDVITDMLIVAGIHT